MNPKLLNQSVEVFNTLEKWNALFEVHDHSEEIMEHWLAIGAKALREEFDANPSQGWECQKWDAEHEVRWNLADFGREAIGIGFGWGKWEFHLHFKGNKPNCKVCAERLLKTTEFRRLLAVFGTQEIIRGRSRDGSLAYDVTFNPFSNAADAEPRIREVAWHAAHQTADFVEKMSAKIRQFTENKKLTSLLIDLNQRSGIKAAK